jgi:hypothetical protein
MTPYGITSAPAGPLAPGNAEQGPASALDEIGVVGAHGQDGDLWNLTGSDYSRDAAWADHAWQ